MAETLPQKPVAGFTFDNFARNAKLAEKGYPAPAAKKTGTTIVGIVFADGVILGADTRATNGSTVAEKQCMKIHYLAPNMYCCGAGTAADCDFTTRTVSSQIELHQLNTGKLVPVATATRIFAQYLFRYQGYISAALILGGVDDTGGHLYQIYPHGSVDSLQFVTMGSGSLAAMAALECGWRPKMGLEEGKKLVRDAVAAGIFNDLGSGSNVDLCVITKSGADYYRPYEVANLKGERQGDYKVPIGGTRIVSANIAPIIVEDVMVRHIEQTESSDAMDTSS